MRRLRLTTLHFAQRGRIDDETFIIAYSFLFLRPASWQLVKQPEVMIIPALVIFVQVYNKVNISGSPSVIATECSKWAVSDPSAEQTVH